MYTKWKGLFWMSILAMVVIYLYIEVGKETELIRATIKDYPTMTRPAFWPRVMLVGLLIATGLKWVLTLRKPKDQQPERSVIKLFLIPKVMISIGIVGMYCYLSQYLGFAFATISFTAGYMWFLGIRKLRMLILFPILSTLGILLVFWRLLYLAVPKGVGIFLMFSNLVMSIVRFET